MSDVLRGATTLKTFCRDHGISLPTAYREIAANRLEARKVGRRTLITREAENRWLNGLPRLVTSPPDPSAE
jgi:excisionase family DNA binding protein